MFDLFAQIFSGLSGAAAQTTAQASTPPAHSANTLANLFQFDADGGAGWASSAFGEPPEWAPWHPDFDEFAHYGPNGKEGGIGLTPQGLGSAGFPNTMSRGNGQTSQTPPTPSRNPQSTTGGTSSNTATGGGDNTRTHGFSTLAEKNALAPGHDKFVDDAKEINTPDVSNKITAQTAPTLVEEPRQVTRSVPLPEQNPISTDSQSRGVRGPPSAQPTQPSMGTPGSHPELPAHQDVNTPTRTQQIMQYKAAMETELARTREDFKAGRITQKEWTQAKKDIGEEITRANQDLKVGHKPQQAPPLPGLNTGRKLSIPLVKQTLGITEGIQRGGWKTTSYPASRDTGRALFTSGKGVMINLDTNAAERNGVPVNRIDPGVVIPDGATKTQRAAAWKYARAMGKVFKERFGRTVKPWVRTTSQNGGGRVGHIHTEPYAVRDAQAVQYFNTEAGQKHHAAILSRTLGQIPGAHFNIPHDGVSGAAANGTNEVKLAEGVMRWLQPDN